MKSTNVSEIIRERRRAAAGNYASSVGPRRWVSLRAISVPFRLVQLTRRSPSPAEPKDELTTQPLGSLQ